jgi:SAM-dependent methyltransferase
MSATNASARALERGAREFEAINQRQAWANWRTIRRNLAVWGPERAVRAVDLCCGTGRSTEVLAYSLEPGSQVLGVDSEARFVAAARERRYRSRLGAEASVSFACQSVLEPLRNADGELEAPASVEVVNSSGAVGCHFDPAAKARSCALDRYWQVCFRKRESAGSQRGQSPNGLIGAPSHQCRSGPSLKTAKCRCGAFLGALPVVPT